MSQIPQPCAKCMLCQLACYMCVFVCVVALRPDNRSYLLILNDVRDGVY